MQKAVLFVTWNRLETTQQSFASIKKAKPPKLYIASDGPREGKEEEREIISKVREWILSNIDWNCEVKTRFLEKNSGGCAKGVSGAVTWFFNEEKDGIILEDDCVASASFFSFCEELLDKYRDDKRVWSITGEGNYEDSKAKASYYFAKIPHCWGWATWADRWKQFKFDLSDYKEENIKLFSKDEDIQEFWRNILKNLQNNTIDSWAYRWTFKVIEQKGYCINPYKNLVSNIGVTGVHYSNSDSILLKRRAYEIEKILHPTIVAYNKIAIAKIYEKTLPIKQLNKKKIKYYLFDFLPLLTIKQKRNIKRYYLLGFIPILQIKRKDDD